MNTRIPPLVAIILALSAASCAAQRPAGPWAIPAGPDSFGVNIHFTDPKPGEMKMIADGGFHWIRMDFGWEGTEREKGRYNFAAYDRLVAACEPCHVRIMFILDYANRLYDNGLSPASDEGRKAFAAWAAAAAERFKGRGILWEMYNEPNIGFWKPRPNVDSYIALAREVGQAIRQAAPDEIYIGPAVSEMDYRFLEACFKAGLLEYWSAVTVHPYLRTNPENMEAHYRKLGLMIEQYAPKGKHIPIISGEWGYSAAWANVGEEKQGKMMARELLTNMAHGVPVSIWYDWHNDGADPKDFESNFGTVRNPLLAGKDTPYEPKPAYTAARTLARFLGAEPGSVPLPPGATVTAASATRTAASAADNAPAASASGAATSAAAGPVYEPFRFARRLAVGGVDDYVYVFARGKEDRMAAWTTADRPHEIVVPVRPGAAFSVTGMLGEKLPDAAADGTRLNITITDAPKYLAPTGPGQGLR